MEEGKFIKKSKTDKYIVIGDYIYDNNELKDGVDYNDNRGRLIENKDSNRHSVKGDEYIGNRKPEDAIKLLETVNSLDVPDKSPQSQVYDVAFNDLKIPINEFKGSIEVGGAKRKVSEYWHGGLDTYKEDVREYLDQIPKLSNAISDKTIEKWYNQTILSNIKGRKTPSSVGNFVGDEKVDNAIKYFSK